MSIYLYILFTIWTICGILLTLAMITVVSSIFGIDKKISGDSKAERWIKNEEKYVEAYVKEVGQL